MVVCLRPLDRNGALMEMTDLSAFVSRAGREYTMNGELRRICCGGTGAEVVSSLDARRIVT